MADTQQPENVAEAVEQRLSGQHIRVLSVVIEHARGGSLGVRLDEVVKDTGLGSSAQIILDELEFTGTITSRLLQVGTGGTCARFYKPAEGTRIKVFGPQKPN